MTRHLLKCFCEFRSRNNHQRHSRTLLKSTRGPLCKERCAACVLSWAARGSGHTAWALFFKFEYWILFLGSQKLTSYSRVDNFKNLSCFLFNGPFVNRKALNCTYAFLICSENLFYFLCVHGENLLTVLYYIFLVQKCNGFFKRSSAF